MKELTHTIYHCNCDEFIQGHTLVFDEQDLREGGYTKCPYCKKPFEVRSYAPEPMPGSEEVCDIAEAMIEFGGSFVKNLGQALLCADENNKALIRSTWPDYWEKYRGMTSQIQRNQKEPVS